MRLGRHREHFRVTLGAQYPCRLICCHGVSCLEVHAPSAGVLPIRVMDLDLTVRKLLLDFQACL